MQFCKIYTSTECTEKRKQLASFMDQKLHKKKVLEIQMKYITSALSSYVVLEADMNIRMHRLGTNMYIQIQYKDGYTVILKVSECSPKSFAIQRGKLCQTYIKLDSYYSGRHENRSCLKTKLFIPPTANIFRKLKKTQR